ncbi:zinc finger, AN1-type domain [Linnemannia schmuckeri]|uniref:Zinc finger, AN1-type domain n=1 Tax=Linnemannia schmuckeri TaxID=64567 RepID=A0A9P5RUH4_9FUNG|nr:zinc finger, AN1-type domain [Linnemannia schmuckeri]
MEFPSVGAHCDSPSCQSLDFLPFQCTFCQKTFCSPHRLPADHACPNWSMESHANSVQVCPLCEQLLLTPKQHNPATILKEHIEAGCSSNLHNLPKVQSIAVLCALPKCNRRDRVVQTCPDCSQTFCLPHRQPSDHNCPKIEERKRVAETEVARRQGIKDTIARKLTGSTTGPTTAATTTGSTMTPEEKQAQTKAKAEAAKTAIAEAKAKIAARSTTTKSGATITATPSATIGTTATPAQPKVRKASRVVTIMKIKKTAVGEDKIPISSRVYVYIRSPVFPQLDDKSVYVDKTWTVGRSMDKIVEWLKIAVPKNEPFEAQKRFSIFHAKELDDTPTILSMQDRLQQITTVESGDVFFLAPADWAWSTQ